MSKVRIGLAKGRLVEDCIEILKKIDINFSDYSKKSRKLIFEDDKNEIELVFVKSSDVPVYVEKGAVDIGIVGKDVLLESPADVYEVLNLNLGNCKLCVAGFPGYDINQSKKLVVGSKYPNAAKSFFNRNRINAEIIKLNGSVELAPILGLSEVIVDIVETGTTLKENGLVILENIYDISARLIVNKVSLKTKNEKIEDIIEKIENVIDYPRGQ